jgi:hypothetical protein
MPSVATFLCCKALWNDRPIHPFDPLMKIFEFCNVRAYFGFLDRF